MRYINQISFLISNLYKGLFLKKIKTTYIDGVKYQGLKYPYLQEINNLNKEMSISKKRLSLAENIIYKTHGAKLVVIALDNNEKVIGFNRYYFNIRDIKENTVHIGFTGVITNWRGRKIAFHMREIAKETFIRGGLSGISTRVSVSNKLCLKSLENNKFRPTEKYFDNILNTERYYLVCRLGIDNDK